MPHALASDLTTYTKDHISDLLSPAVLKAMSVRFEANAAQWLADNAPAAKATAPRKPKNGCGPKPKVIVNPFYNFIGCTTCWGRYPVFAMDIIEGIARLDWHDRTVGQGGKSMPLSVHNLVVILESLPVATNKGVEDLLQLQGRHARRYVKAVELIIPNMMRARPKSLYNEMEGIEPEPKACEWDDGNNSLKPSAEELAKLHYDMRTFTEFKTAEEYEAEHPIHPASTNIIGLSIYHEFQNRHQHPKKHDVLRMLAQGVAIKAIERATKVSAKTIRKWRDEMQSIEYELQAA